jgi:hypothetical protein
VGFSHESEGSEIFQEATLRRVASAKGLLARALLWVAEVCG